MTGGTVEVAVIGAGFGGLGVAIQLERAGRGSFVVLERGDDVGGTWRDNVYPGVACDIPSALYSWSFRPSADWSRRFAPGAEIQAYLRAAAAEEGVLDRIRLGTEVTACEWLPADRRWRVTTTSGVWHADTVVLAVGRLSEPRRPDLPGLDDVDVPVVHTARWAEAPPVRGRRVAVIGTGASAIQLVPELVDQAAHVTVFQRHAPWVLPREDRAVDAVERATLRRDPGRMSAARHRLFEEAETGFDARAGDPVALAALRDRALAHLAAQVPDPAQRRSLTPDYEIGCKRILFSDDWYPAVTGPGVTLVPSGAARVGPGTVHAEDGSVCEADLIVLATGFHAARPPFAHRVTGRDGGTLAAHWADGLRAHASTVMTGFPQLFVLNGPHATLGHSSAIDMLETQTRYLLDALDDRDARGGAPVEVRPEIEANYLAQVHRRAEGTVWLTGGCDSWYLDRGRLALIWPGTASDFRAAVRYRAEDFRPVG